MTLIASPEVAARLARVCRERPLAIFDLETTGSDRLHDRIIEFGALRVSTGGEAALLEKRVNPGVRIPRESTAIHGISNPDVDGLPLFAAVASEIAEFLAGCDLAGYSIRAFDIPVLLKEFDRAGVKFSLDGRRIVDAQTIFFKKEPRDLSAALRFFTGRPHEKAHSALADAIASAEVLAGELDRYADLPQTIPGLADFSSPVESRFVDSNKRFFWRDGQAVFAFGEYRGKELSEVATSHANYLEWILARDFPEETKEIVRGAQKGIFPVRGA